MAVLIEPGGARALYYTTSSCGHDWSKELLRVKRATSIERLSRIHPGSDLFPSLTRYAHQEGLHHLSELDVVRYFADRHVIDANRTAHFDPKIRNSANNYIGVLLANCVLWPLDEDGVYRLGQQVVSIRGAVDLGGQGSLFLHRGAMFRLSIPATETVRLKEAQLKNKLFVAALSRVGGELVLPILPAGKN